MPEETAAEIVQEPIVESDPAEDKWESLDFSEQEVAEPEPTPEPEEQAISEDRPAEIPSEEPTIEQIEAAQGGPTPLPRNKLREIESKLISPLRDPNVEIASVRQALAEFQPERMRAMELDIVNESAGNHPNEWLQAITGIDGITVDKVKQWHENPAPQPEPGDDLSKYLSDIYGEDWKDESVIDQMNTEDARLANIALQMEKVQGQPQTTELQEKYNALDAQLKELMPQFEDFKKKQEADYQSFEKTTYETKVNEYTSAVEQRVVPKILTEAGLDVSENDTDGVKAVKELVRGSFEAKYGASQFDLYLGNEYPQREALGKTVQRVDSLIQLAAQKEAQAEKKATSVEDAKRLRSEAQSHWSEAMNEQDAVTVMHKKAAAEFLKTLSGPMSLLEENAQLQQQLGRNGQRVEITGSGSAPGQTLREKLREAKGDKWDLAFEEMAQPAR